MNVQLQPFGLGSLIAIVVLIVVIVLALIGHLAPLFALLVGGLALARLC